MSYLLRVVLPDRPGMLGAIATALGEAGADIVSLDVVERGPDGAVDDLLVQLPPGRLADSLLTAAHSVPGVVVESLRPYLGADDLHRDLELVDEVAAAPQQALRLLTELAPGVFRAGWALLLIQTTVLARTTSAPDVPSLPIFPLRSPRSVDSAEPWIPGAWKDLGVELALAPVGDAETALLVGRPGGPRFRTSEVMRLAHLAGLAATVASAGADGSAGRVAPSR